MTCQSGRRSRSWIRWARHRRSPMLLVACRRFPGGGLSAAVKPRLRRSSPSGFPKTARSRLPLPKVHAASPSLRVRVRAGSAGRVGMKRLAPLPRQVSSSPAPNRTCESPRIRLSMRGVSHGWPSQRCEGVPNAHPSIAHRRSTNISTRSPTSELVRRLLTGLRPSVRFPSSWRTR